MSEIIYSGISITTDALSYYISTIQHSKKKESYEKWKDRHATGIAESVMLSLSMDNIQFDSKDATACALLEQLIREVGYDSDGHYTHDAHVAFRVLNEKRGLDHNLFELKDIQIKKSSSHEFKFLGMGLFSKIKESISSKVKSAINSLIEHTGIFWSRGKKIAVGGAVVLGGAAGAKYAPDVYQKYFSKNVPPSVQVFTPQQDTLKTTIVLQAKQVEKKENKYKDTKTVPNDTFILSSKHSFGTSLNSRTDSLKRIEANKKNYQESRRASSVIKESRINRTTKPLSKGSSVLSRNDSIDNNPYISSLEIHHATHLISKTKEQLNKGIFKAEKGITKERIAHAYLMCQTYANWDPVGTKIVLDAFNSKKKLTPAQQKAFTNYIINGVGERGIALQALSIQKGNKNHHCAFNNASKKQQQRHIKNLQDVRRLHSR